MPTSRKQTADEISKTPSLKDLIIAMGSVDVSDFRALQLQARELSRRLAVQLGFGKDNWKVADNRMQKIRGFLESASLLELEYLQTLVKLTAVQKINFGNLLKACGIDPGNADARNGDQLGNQPEPGNADARIGVQMVHAGVGPFNGRHGMTLRPRRVHLTDQFPEEMCSTIEEEMSFIVHRRNEEGNNDLWQERYEQNEAILDDEEKAEFKDNVYNKDWCKYRYTRY